MFMRGFLVCLLFISLEALASKPPIYSHHHRGAIKGADVVAYYDLQEGEKAIKGSKEITYDWGGTTWRFANEENRQKFIENPEKYVPAYGGYCAFAVSKGFLAPPRPNSWAIVDGKLYLNNNGTSHRIWKKSLEDFLARGEENWPKVLGK